MNFAAQLTNGRSAAPYRKCILVAAMTGLLIGTAVADEVPRRFPCDPKFGLLGNYIEMTLGTVTGDNGRVQVCFEKKNQADEETDCLSLHGLPGRYMNTAGWSEWRIGLQFDHGNTVYQFGLCGEKRDDSVWQNFHKGRGVDSWDHMLLRNATTGSIFVESVRVVQNRVRILDDERADEGRLHVSLGLLGQREVHLSQRIRRSKINRVNCLNLQPGRPYCEERISGLDPDVLPPIIKQALLELGHSGSEKYGRRNDAWCSEFAFFVIDESVRLSEKCSNKVPDPVQGDLSANKLFKWFSSCGRVIPRNMLKSELRPGDYLSVGERKHSTLFLGWADTQKKFFWEISGNNQCRPELETMMAPTFMSNTVCIAKREFLKEISENDFGGRTRR